MPYKDKETERLRNQRYYQEHKEEIKQRSSDWVTAHPERRKEISRLSRRRNYAPGNESEKRTASERASKWAKDNPDRINARNRAWRLANPEKARAAQKQWRDRNRSKQHEYKMLRRARKFNAGFEQVNRDVVYERANGICGICHQSVSRDKFHVDHIIPLSKGGLHCYANVQPAHRVCNSRKGNKLIARLDQT